MQHPSNEKDAAFVLNGNAWYNVYRFTKYWRVKMNKLLIIYAAVVFIIAVVVFTYAELHKNSEEEPETYKWMKVFSFVLLTIAVVCFFAGKG